MRERKFKLNDKVILTGLPEKYKEFNGLHTVILDAKMDNSWIGWMYKIEEIKLWIHESYFKIA